MPTFNVPLAGRIEPLAPSWKTAGTADRTAFYARAGEVAVRELRAQLMRGVGADGDKMIPRQHPRPDGASGPVLSPHGAESRTERLMDFHAWKDGVTVFWRSGHSRTQKLPWGQILNLHASGLVIGGYVRDVRPALSTVRKIRAEMTTWWDTRTRRNPPGGRRPTGTTRRPPPAAKRPRADPRVRPRDEAARRAAEARARDEARKAQAAADRRAREAEQARVEAERLRAAREEAARRKAVAEAEAGREKAERERRAAERARAGAERRRQARERDAARKAEAARLRAEKGAAEKARREAERLKAEEARLEAERQRAERARKAAEDAARRKAEEEAGKRAEGEAKKKADAEQKRLEAEKAAREKAAAERARRKAEKERLEAERAKAELARLRAREAEWERARLEAEKARQAAIRKQAETPHSDAHARSIEAARQRQRGEAMAAAKADRDFRDRQKVLPDLIPRGPIADRIRAYHVGDAKVEAIKAVAAEHGAAVKAGERALFHTDFYLDSALGRLEFLARNPGRAAPGEVAAIEASLPRLRAERAAAGAAYDRFREALTRVIEVPADRRAAVSFAPVAAGTVSSDGKALAPVSGGNVEAVGRATAWLARVTHRGDDPGVRVAVGQAPDARAHWDNRRGHIQITAGEKDHVVVHEFGHVYGDKLGYFSPRRLEAETVNDRDQEFLRHRVGDEPPTPMNEVGGGGYGADEVGRKDRFDEVFPPELGGLSRAYYCGKDYGSRATEILSMGLEKLYDDPVGFVTKDPEYAKYVLGILDGSLR